MGKQRRRWGLQELEARWLETEGHRHNIGIEIDCPRHGSHRLTIRFLHPYDGSPAVPGPGTWVLVAENGSLSVLTLTNLHGGDELDFGMCGRFRVLEGHVEIVR